ncbi:MAG: helix-turn-helix domain-containing protein [Spirochaetaceae bacterium]|nr:helix-turn-helix domain-containing protein [Spirochaetaceae bacterium]
MGFRENLKAELDFSGILVKELAARSGVKKKTIDSYLSNKCYSPSAEAAVSIAKALGVSVEFLVTGIEAIKDIPPFSITEDIKEIVLVSRQLNTKDRNVILQLAYLLKNR